MDKWKKARLIIAFLAFAAGILSIKYQYFIGIIITISTLTILFYNNSSVCYFFLLAVLLTLIYPLPQSGWLYGRDSHAEAFAVSELLLTGSLTGDIGAKFAGTPFLYINAAITSKITGLSVIPSITSKLLVTFVLPILYLLSLLLVAYVIAGTRTQENYSLALLPVLFWIPMLSFRSGFRRGSLGLVFFTIIVYLTISNRGAKRQSLLFILVALGLILTHHVATAMAILWLLAYLSTQLIEWTPVHVTGSVDLKKMRLMNLEYLTIFTIIVSLTWYLFYNIAGIQAITIFSTMLGDSTVSGGAKGSYSLYHLLTNFLSKWAYQAVLALLVIGGLVLNRQNKRSVIAVIIFGIVTGSGSVIAWQSGSIGYTRIMDYFVIASVIGTSSWYLDSSKVSKFIEDYNIKTVSVALIIVLSFAITPAHVISNQQPVYSQNEYSQRYDQAEYAGAQFLVHHSSKTVVADSDFGEVYHAYSDTVVFPNPTILRSGNVPPSSVFVSVYPRNKYTYYGTGVGARNIVVQDPNIQNRLSTNNIIYSSGRVIVYT